VVRSGLPGATRSRPWRLARASSFCTRGGTDERSCCTGHRTAHRHPPIAGP
jgi:hypothetical protein